MKTLQQWDEDYPDLEMDDFLQPFDEIDEAFYWRIACGYLPAHYQWKGLIQGGDPIEKVSDGVNTYSTVNIINGKFYYLGELPEFKI